MAAHGRARHARPPEPSWPTVIATTVRLWLERRVGIDVRIARARRLLALAAAVVAVLVTAVVVDAIVQRGPASNAVVPRKAAPALAALRAASVTRGQAAAWIAGQVSTGAIVACDPAMCGALQASGRLAGSLLRLGSAAPDPLGSDVIVATPAVRSQFGSRLENVYAPLMIASFGAGAERIDVRATAPDGAAAYESGLAADRRARIAAGGQLLGNPHIKVSAAARAALAAGRVDTRLLAMFAALAAQQPVRIVAFGDRSPGASTVPFRSAVFGPAGEQILSFLHGQQPPYVPDHIRAVGRSLLSIEFDAPSPLGLLAGRRG
ncbi:MAG: hypothetical protein JOY82_09185 [Streptosporangiaceae bacterium]|nr:hypothetical protein [Streptosporangiaceae bacterium]MBV9854686.1 hypothetical protein [Streptosporangiaceae bacterium]